MPESLVKRPRLRADCGRYLTAFYTLSAARDSNGWGLNPIRIGEIKDYALLLGRGGEEALKLLRVVQAMDLKYLGYLAEKNKTP
jgi:hypothetical protein